MKIIFRATFSAYLSFFAVPLFFIVIGIMAAGKTNLNSDEYIIFFVIPIFCLVLSIFVLYYNIIEISDEFLVLKRFSIFKLRVENYIINKNEIQYGVLSNKYRVKKGIEIRSKLKIVPVSVLYIEYKKNDIHFKIAFNVGFYNNAQLRSALAAFRKINSEHYGGLPGI